MKSYRKTDGRRLARLLLICMGGAASCGGIAEPTDSGIPDRSEDEFTEFSNKRTSYIKADIWADNWFALYHEDRLIKEDSVSFKTERSFNAESFRFSIRLPATLSVVMKDYYENDSGLEYIGRHRQQMGDGGFIAQFGDAETNRVLAISNKDWRCRVIHRAPLNADCVYDTNPEQSCKAEIVAEPGNWRQTTFDDSSWQNATEYSARAIRPHGGFRSVDWLPEAKLIWADDLEKDNVVLCRFTISAAN